MVDFWADWCGPCQQIKPLFRQLHNMLGAITTFAKVDVDENEGAAQRFKIESLPTVLILRGGGRPEHVVAKLEGGGAGFAPRLLEAVKNLATPQDLALLAASARPDRPSAAAAAGVAVDANALKSLALAPLESLKEFVVQKTRLERGLQEVPSDVAALEDVGPHEAAQTAVASSMLVMLGLD